MQDELNQFDKNSVWYLDLRLSHQSIVGTLWAFKNKWNENGLKKKKQKKQSNIGSTRLQRRIWNFEDTFAPVSKIEAIRIFLVYASYKHFNMFQIDVKSVS